jgi:hypothetical protein
VNLKVKLDECLLEVKTFPSDPLPLAREGGAV